MDFDFDTTHWGKLSPKSYLSNLFIDAGQLMVDDLFFRTFFINGFHYNFPKLLPAPEIIKKQEKDIKPETIRNINPIERYFFLSPIDCDKISTSILKENRTPLIFFLEYLIWNSKTFFGTKGEIFSKLLDKGIINDSKMKIKFCEFCPGLISITHKQNKIDCSHKNNEFILYYIDDNNFLNKWKFSPEFFLEYACFSILNKIYTYRTDFLNNINVFNGEKSDTKKSRQITEFDFIIKKKIVLLCSINSGTPEERDQIKYARKFGFKIIFVTTEKDEGKKIIDADAKIFDFLNDKNFEKKLRENIEALLK